MWEIQISIAAEQADPLAEVLAEGDAPAWHVLSDVDAGQSRLTGYFESKPAAQAAWDELRKTLPEAIAQAEPSYRELGDSDWKDSYKAHFHAWQFDRIHWVPIWEREQYTIPDGHEAVWLDPGLAFGTGNHETTRLCVERLVHCRRDWEREGRDFEQMRILDAGCGSGILAISAAKCGFTRVAGFDNDPIAVEVSQENAALNGLAGKIEFYEAGLPQGLLNREADLLFANILANVLREHAEPLIDAVRPGGRLILSGILSSEINVVEARFRPLVPNASISSRQLNEWADLLIERE